MLMTLFDPPRWRAAKAEAREAKVDAAWREGLRAGRTHGVLADERERIAKCPDTHAAWMSGWSRALSEPKSPEVLERYERFKADPMGYMTRRGEDV